MGNDDANSTSRCENPPSKSPPIRSPLSTREVMEAGMKCLCEALESYSEMNTSSSTREHLCRRLGFVQEAIQRIDVSDQLDIKISPQWLPPSPQNPFYQEGIGNSPRKMNRSAPSKNKSTPRKLGYELDMRVGYISHGSNSPPTQLESTVRAIGRSWKSGGCNVHSKPLMCTTLVSSDLAMHLFAAKNNTHFLF